MIFEVKKCPVSMSDPRFDSIADQIAKSYPTSCVLWIDEIYNDDLLAKYVQKKDLLTSMYGKTLEEKSLFHGTKEHCIDPISVEGFRAELNVCSAYGKGTYFAENALTSVGYMRGPNSITYMFLADVLIGKKTLPQNKTGAVGECSVDNTSKPSIYVVPENDSTYPRYIIAFHKDADKIKY